MKEPGSEVTITGKVERFYHGYQPDKGRIIKPGEDSLFWS